MLAFTLGLAALIALAAWRGASRALLSAGAVMLLVLYGAALVFPTVPSQNPFGLAAITLLLLANLRRDETAGGVQRARAASFAPFAFFGLAAVTLAAAALGDGVNRWLWPMALLWVLLGAMQLRRRR